MSYLETFCDPFALETQEIVTTASSNVTHNTTTRYNCKANNHNLIAKQF